MKDKFNAIWIEEDEVESKEWSEDGTMKR